MTKKSVLRGLLLALAVIALSLGSGAAGALVALRIQPPMQGAAGPMGPAGPAGLAGPKGADAQLGQVGLCVAGTTLSTTTGIVYVTTTVNSPTSNNGVISCPTGSFVPVQPQAR